MAGVATKLNEESMECAQTHGSVLCVRVKAPRVEAENDYVGCALTKKNTTCWTQDMRSLRDAEWSYAKQSKGDRRYSARRT